MLAAGDLERLAQASASAELDHPLDRHARGQHPADPARATTRRDRRSIPRSIASMPTSSGATRVNGPARRSRRSAAAVANPRRVMSVSSSAK